MDGTPYPPPAPPVPPPGAPQPQYAPAQPPAQPPKKKTGLIIGIVVAVLLLCCLGTSVAGYLVFKNAEDTTDETLTDPGAWIDSDGGDAVRTYEGSEWAEFQPELEDPSIYSRPSPAQLDMIEDVNSSLYPDFEVDDVVLEEGYKEEESFYPNMLYVQASLSDDPAVRIAYYLWADWEEATAAGFTLSEDQTESYETYDVASDGTGYIYDNENLEGLIFGVSDQDVVDVLAQADADFPDYVAMQTTPRGDTCEIAITRWEAFPDLVAGLLVTYERDGDSWSVTSVEEQ